MRYSIQDIPKITISCQSRSGQPFYKDDYILEKIIDSVVLGGAQSVRVDGSDIIAYTKAKYPNVFVIGFKKVLDTNSPLLGWVTPDLESAIQVIESKPDLLVLDGSTQLHTKESLQKLISDIKARSDVLIGCDIGTENEALRAIECGASVVLTTFTQAETRENKPWKDHASLVKNLVGKNIPVIAEGGILTEYNAKELLLAGAMSVVVGKTIVDPVFNTKRFIAIEDQLQQEKLYDLFEGYFNERPISFDVLTPHGSARTYIKLQSANYLALGTIGNDKKENRVFIELARHLEQKGVPVPKVFNTNDDCSYYVQEFCGDGDLFTSIKNRFDDSYTLLKKAIDLLVDFQTKGTKEWDFAHSYPFARFEANEIIRDTERFKKRFLENLSVSFSEEALNEERDRLIKEIDQIPESEYVLMHRDFQTRNILNRNGQYILIDFQGSRKGPVHYDLASILFQSQLDYSNELRNSLVEYFLSKNPSLDTNTFMRNFYLITVVRLIQSIGSYGIAGLEGKKEYFLTSIPYALKNLKEILLRIHHDYAINFPELYNAVQTAERNFNNKTI